MDRNFIREFNNLKKKRKGKLKERKGKIIPILSLKLVNFSKKNFNMLLSMGVKTMILENKLLDSKDREERTGKFD